MMLPCHHFVTLMLLKKSRNLMKISKALFLVQNTRGDILVSFWGQKMSMYFITDTTLEKPKFQLFHWALTVPQKTKVSEFSALTIIPFLWCF
jgi:hypothetical protein